VYRKGLLVAALYDLELRWQSRGKNRLSQVIGNLYRDYALTRREIGNREVLDALRRAGNFSQQIANDIEGANEIELLSRLEVYGIIMDRSIAQGRARLVPSPRLSDRQEQLIAQLKGM
jgi:predicted metalloprotease with PDZ domain